MASRKSATHFDSVHELKTDLRGLNLHTVCESARCPNMHECFHRGAATFMILGNLCTRGCGFCSVPKGSPQKHEFTLDPDEPANVARMAAQMKLRYVVITASIATIWPMADRITSPKRSARCGSAARCARRSADAGFLRRSGRGGASAGCRPARLQPQHGDDSAAVPAGAAAGRITGSRWTCCDSRKRYRPEVLTKSGLMVGLGEQPDEVELLLRDLARVRGGCRDHRAVSATDAPQSCRWPNMSRPAQFDAYRDYGLSIGFKMVFSGPLVRSSYMADLVNEQASQATR